MILTVNGKRHDVDVSADMPLLWVIRDVIGLTGTKKVTTIEGLSPTTSHALQLAWIAEQVPQCGYCQSGQLMSAAALLAKTPRPTDRDIDVAMNGNICRCGTYIRIRQAIHKAAALSASRPGHAAHSAS